MSTPVSRQTSRNVLHTKESAQPVGPPSVHANEKMVESSSGGADWMVAVGDTIIVGVSVAQEVNVDHIASYNGVLSIVRGCIPVFLASERRSELYQV